MLAALFFAATIEQLISAGQYQQALDALTREEKDARWHLLASKAYDGLNQPGRAVEEAEAALAIAPRWEAAHLQLGMIFLARNTPEAALDIFNDARKLFPDAVVIRLGLGLAFKDLQRWDEAESELAACWPNPIAFDSLLTILNFRGKFEEARDLSERFTRTAPRDWRGHYHLAAAKDGLREEGKTIVPLIQKAIDLKPDLAAAHALLGKVALREGRLADAIPALEQAIRLRPDLVQAHLQLAQTYQKLGRTVEADKGFAMVRALKEKEAQPREKLSYGRGKPK